MAARKFIVDHGLNEVVVPRASSALHRIGVIVQGGRYNTRVGALVQCGCADAFGNTDAAILVP